MKFGFVKLDQPLNGHSHVTPRFIDQFVREQLLSGGAMINARYVQVVTSVKIDTTRVQTNWVIKTKTPGVFYFNTDFALYWYSERYIKYPVESFFLWLIIECLTALRGNFIEEWSIDNENFINHRHFQGILSEEDLSRLGVGNRIILAEWKKLPDREGSGKSLLQNIDKWTFNFMVNWILRKNIRWAHEPEELAFLIRRPALIARAIAATSKFSLPVWLKTIAIHH